MRESALTLAIRLNRCQWLMNAVLPVHCQLGRDALAQLTRAVTIVEGEWDRRLLHRFYGTRLAQKRVLVVPLQCSNELGGMADAAVIPALGLPVVALLDEIRGSTREELRCLPTPNKAERALLDLARALGDALRFVRYDDPDVICALPEAAVRRALPAAVFAGWDALLEQWRSEQDKQDDSAPFVPFKRWALKAMGLPKAKQHPTKFFTDVLAHCEPAIGLRDLVRKALRMRPGWIVVGTSAPSPSPATRRVAPKPAGTAPGPGGPSDGGVRPAAAPARR